MINNRQGGRRRGRGGGGPRPNNAPSGNRQDNRQRGNAAQLLEKYRQLARDAQMSGDRVQSETFLQYAEHYFRVLNENRSRFEEQRRGREDEYGDEDEGEDDLAAEGFEGNEDDARRPPRREYREREGREPREAREPREQRDVREPREAREPRDYREPREARPPREPRAAQGDDEQRNGEQRYESRPRRTRRNVNDDAPAGDTGGREDGGQDEARLSLDILPPAISIATTSDGDEPEAPRPRRRTRTPRANDGDTTPAAA